MNFNPNQSQSLEQKDSFFGIEESAHSDVKNQTIYKKTEKVSKALFLVTQHLSDNTPLKKHVRDSALNLLDIVSQIAFSSEQVPMDLSHKKAQVNRLVTFTLSLTDLATASGLMSYKNGSIITDNIVSYKNELISHIEQLIYKIESQVSATQNSPEAQVDLSHSFFEIDAGEDQGQTLFDTTERMSDNVSGPQADMGHVSVPHVPMSQTKDSSKGQSSVNVPNETPAKSDSRTVQNPQATTANPAASQVSEPVKKTSTLIHKFSGSREGLNQFLNSMHMQNAHQGTPAKAANVTHAEPYIKNDRQQVILNTIREKGELSIKDLTDVIQGCSEKTIQRELISLVATGILNKTGERRWSKYSLATT